MFVTVIPILLTVYAFGRAVAFPSPSATHRHASVIIRDVCIIGGGSSGTYAAIGLRDKGKSVALIEAQSLLGGHTNTYTDPATSKKVDYGVIIFPNTSTVTSYFDRFNILLTPGNGSPSTAVENYYVDFRTGRTVTGYSLPDTTAAFSAYATQVAKYPFLNIPGWHLPDPVPEDLLTPFGDFVKKYQLDDAVSTINEYAQGFGDLLSIPTLYVLKYFNVPPVQAGASSTSLTTARHDNSELYEKAREELGEDVFLSSTVIATSRNRRGVKITIKTPQGFKTILARKLVISIPPLLSNLRGFDLSEAERDLFGLFSSEAYYTGLLRNTGIPENVVLNNVATDSPYNIPPEPSIYGLFALSTPNVTGLKNFQFGASTALSESAVKASVVSAISKLQIAGTIPTASTPEFVAYNSHTPYELHVSADAIRAGFYKNLTALQGQRNTWWTGAAFSKHASSDLWAFTDGLLPDIAA
ncbi:MAG: hypothetical protein LQ343_001221 [Gyalolechia ehrenbergii]|nr:MAG: hypothetical protein LQ343_001221 [Gyalolechia ehrenbergii]